MYQPFLQLEDYTENEYVGGGIYFQRAVKSGYCYGGSAYGGTVGYSFQLPKQEEVS